MITSEQKQQLLDFVNSLEVEEPKAIKTNISELGGNDVINTATEAEYYRICILLHLAGYTWYSGKSLLNNENRYRYYLSETCLSLRVEYTSKSYYEDRGYTIIPSFQITGV